MQMQMHQPPAPPLPLRWTGSTTASATPIPPHWPPAPTANPFHYVHQRARPAARPHGIQRPRIRLPVADPHRWWERGCPRHRHTRPRPSPARHWTGSIPPSAMPIRPHWPSARIANPLHCSHQHAAAARHPGIGMAATHRHPLQQRANPRHRQTPWHPSRHRLPARPRQR